MQLTNYLPRSAGNSLTTKKRGTELLVVFQRWFGGEWEGLTRAAVKVWFEDREGNRFSRIEELPTDGRQVAMFRE